MYTPAHIAASLLVWKDEPGWTAAAAVTFGAALPDLPMFGFYVVSKLSATSERDIWSTLYFEDHWQLLFDAFNSIPIFLLLVIVSMYVRSPLGVLLSASAILHVLCDLPVHHEDAHRHFLPLSDWRFRSPVSYWDPQRFGIPFAIAELTFAVGSSLYVGLRANHRPMRIMGWSMLGLYVMLLLLVASLIMLRFTQRG